MKTRVQDLARFGGAPLFDADLPVGRPNIGDRSRLVARFNEMLDRRWLTNDGPAVRQFEGALATFLGVPHCIAVSNATVALGLAIRALGLSGEVIVPSFTFVATAHALSWLGITPVFCDIDAKTHNISAEHAEHLITQRTTGIIGVHLWGQACDVTALQTIARKRGLRLLFDAAHALGCTYGGVLLGGFGDAEVLSFHATKVVNSFEGGAILTRDAELARRVRLMRNFGFSGYDTVECIGINGKMSEASAVMGLTSLESYDHFVEVNRSHYERYEAELDGVPGVHVMRYGPERANYHYVIVEIDEAEAGITRDQVQEILWAERILVRRYFYPGCHRMEPYRAAAVAAGARLPETERVCERVMALPTGTSMTADGVRLVSALLRFVVANAPVIRQAWPAQTAR
jgi:dTDP-4-amino-4,6-dideoxygalactose transaminase